MSQSFPTLPMVQAFDPPEDEKLTNEGELEERIL